MKDDDDGVNHESARFLEDDPPIAILAEGERTLRVAVWTLQGDEHELVAGAARTIPLIAYLAKAQSSQRDGTVSWSLSAVARSQEGSASLR